MSRAARCVCFVIAAALPSGMTAPYAGACAICTMPEGSFSLPHPYAIRMAVATRAAIENGLIGDVSPQRAEELEAELVRTGSIVAYPFSKGQPAVIDLLLVDDGSVYRLELHGSKSQIARYRPDVHRPALARIVTTRAVAHALSSVQIRLAEAMSRGLVKLEAGRPGAPQAVTYSHSR